MKKIYIYKGELDYTEMKTRAVGDTLKEETSAEWERL